MTRKRKPYKTYTKEFEQEAIRLMETSDKPAAEIAMELGIRLNQQYRIIYRVERDNILVKVVEVTPHDYRRK